MLTAVDQSTEQLAVGCMTIFHGSCMAYSGVDRISVWGADSADGCGVRVGSVLLPTGGGGYALSPKFFFDYLVLKWCI